MKADLHIHTTRSDGTYSTREVIDRAAEQGLECIAITDHDTLFVDHDCRAYAREKGITLIPGIELSSEFGGHSMHIVGLYIDDSSEPVLNLIETVRTNRHNRNLAILDKFKQEGIDISLDELNTVAQGKIIARPHFAKILIERGIVRNNYEAFDTYLANGAKCHVPRVKISAKDYFDAIREAGGISIFAHPGLYPYPSHSEFVTTIKELISLGLNGIEVYCTVHNKKQAKFFKKVADEHDLIISGGSDYHGALKPTVELGAFFGHDQLSHYVDRILRTQ